MSKWTGLEKPITAAIADAEPEAQRLFGPSYAIRQAALNSLPEGIDRADFSPWKKPRIERVKR